MFLPDESHFFYFAQGDENAQGIFLGTLDSPESVRITSSDVAGAFLTPGWLVWVRAQALVEEGRILVLEIMGYMANFYRHYYQHQRGDAK